MNKQTKIYNRRNTAFREGSFLFCFYLSYFRTQPILKQGVIELQLWQFLSKKISLYHLNTKSDLFLIYEWFYFHTSPW